MKKVLKKVLGIAFLLFVVFELFAIFSDKFYLNKAVWHNFSNIDDYKIFHNHKALANNPLQWEKSSVYNTQQISEVLQKQHEALGTVAFAIIKDGQLVYENYYDEYDSLSISGSFSMAKSYVGAMVGVALKQGKIKSLDQKIGEFLPEFNKGRLAYITIKHLLTMSSGLSWHESYSNPLANTTECYYGRNIQKVINKLEAIKEPGLEFQYLSGDSQVLGLLLMKIYNKSLIQILSKELWLPLQSTQDVLWSVDKKGVEKAFCCMSATARDYARLGQLYLQKGNWGGAQLLDSSYIVASTKGNVYKNEKADYYGYQWWLLNGIENENIFYMRGIHGQYVICFPERNIVTVRLGKKRGEKSDGIHTDDVYLIVKEIIELDNQNKL